MATRRAHHKSRLGCQQCKKRRIKCDIKQPSCTNCNKKGLDCSFLLLAPTSRLSVLSSSSSTSPRIIGSSTSPGSVSSAASVAGSPATQPSQPGSPESALTTFSGTTIQSDVISECSISPGLEVIQLASPERLPYLELSLPRITIPPSLRCHDAWKDIRQNLPPTLRNVLLHYEYTTSITLAADDPAKAAWQSFVPEMASRHQFLVNCVLSVAALHLGRLHDSQEEKRKMQIIAVTRMNKAIAEYRPELECITKDNAAALFASVTLTAVYLFRTSALDIENLRASIPQGTLVPPPDIADKMFSCAFRTIHGLRGPLAVLISGWRWVVGGRMHPVAERDWWPNKRMPATLRAMEEDERLRKLEDMWIHNDNPTENEHLSQALTALRDTFALVSQLTLPEVYQPISAAAYCIDDTTIGILTDRGAIFVWASLVSREFLQLLEAKHIGALIILAHYAVLPGRVRNVWWLEGLGADIVTAVAMVLGRENWGLVAWPASVVGLDLESALCPRRKLLEGRYEVMSMEVI